MSADELTDADKPAPVTATLSDGTPVTSGMTLESNTQITLSTTTPNAEIRYTLDDTCPCKEDALRYEGPITITKDTVLRAAALLDGVYSDTIRLEQMCIRDSDTTSRSMIVTILYRLEGEPVVDDAMDFADVAGDAWYTDAVRWAARCV